MFLKNLKNKRMFSAPCQGGGWEGVNRQKGMTYVELIVVLAIFSIMSAVALYNHRSFDDQVNISNLAQDIALQVVGQQKNAIFGKLPTAIEQGQISSAMANSYPPPIPSWKPSYGVYININNDPHSIILFADANQNKLYDGFDCSSFGPLDVDECTDKLTLSTGVSITNICSYIEGEGCFPFGVTTGMASAVFTRPDSIALVSDGTTLVAGGLAISIANTDGSIQKTIYISSAGRVSVE